AAVHGGELGGDRLAQRQDAADLGVLAYTLVERCARGVLDVRGRVEVGLAGTEADDVDAVGLELGGLRGDRERDRGLDGIEAGRDLEGCRHGHPWTVYFLYFALSAATTGAGTRPVTSPPRLATSLTSEDD